MKEINPGWIGAMIALWGFVGAGLYKVFDLVRTQKDHDKLFLKQDLKIAALETRMEKNEDETRGELRKIFEGISVTNVNIGEVKGELKGLKEILEKL